MLIVLQRQKITCSYTDELLACRCLSILASLSRYSIEYLRPTFNMTIVMIDTVTLCGNTEAADRGGQPKGLVDKQQEQDQLEFIEGKLRNNK